jgi:hypothetical protein
LLKNEDFTGYRIVPCLHEKRDHTVEQYAFDNINPELEQEADFFQLIVEKQVAKPVDVGRLMAWYQCANCGYVRAFQPHLIDGKARAFKADWLKSSDFHFCHRYNTQNLGVINMLSASVIISARVMRFLVDNNVTGLQGGGYGMPSSTLAFVSIQEYK